MTFAEELHAAMAASSWAWMNYVDAEDETVCEVGTRRVRVNWQDDGSAIFADPSTGAPVGHFRVTLEEVSG